MAERRRQLDKLLLSYREVGRRLLDVNRHAEIRKQVLRASVYGLPINQTTSLWDMTDEDVLRNREVGEGHGLLVNERDAAGEAIRRAAELDHLTTHTNRARGSVHTRDGFAEAGLPGTILADYGMNLPWLKGEVNF
jgi:hypothetical protein